MKTNKTLSSVSIAAIALMAAAVPCFAQAGSNETRTETAVNTRDTTVASVRISRPVVTVAPFAVKSRNSDVVAPNRGESLNAALLKSVAPGQNLVSNPQLKSADKIFNDTNSQFKNENRNVTERRQSEFEFVPSRGQKSPE